MTNVKRLFFSLFLLFLLGTPVKAASFSMSASTKNVAPNGTFTIKVGGDCIGRVDLKVTNGTLSTSSVWVEQGYTSVSVKANASGVVTVVATPVQGFSDADANLYNPGTRSVSVNVTSPSSSSSSGTTNPPSSTTKKPNQTVKKPEKSGDNTLKSLSISEGKLSPSFNKNHSEYTLDLSSNISEITIHADTTDAKAKVEGIGKVKVKPGNNEIKLIVTAENGTKKTYTIKAYVEEVPNVYLKYKNEEVGIIRNYKNVTIPENFEKEEYTIGENTIPIFVKGKIQIVYGMNQKNEKNFYVFNKEENKLINILFPISWNNKIFYILDKDPAREKVTKEMIELNSQTFDCYTFNENQNYCLFYTMNEEGKVIEYLYEKEENSIQLFPEFLTICDVAAEKNSPFFFILVGILLVEVVFGIGWFINRKRNLQDEKAK